MSEGSKGNIVIHIQAQTLGYELFRSVCNTLVGSALRALAKVGLKNALIGLHKSRRYLSASLLSSLCQTGADGGKLTEVNPLLARKEVRHILLQNNAVILKGMCNILKRTTLCKAQIAIYADILAHLLNVILCNSVHYRKIQGCVRSSLLNGLALKERGS